MSNVKRNISVSAETLFIEGWRASDIEQIKEHHQLSEKGAEILQWELEVLELDESHTVLQDELYRIKMAIVEMLATERRALKDMQRQAEIYDMTELVKTFDFAKGRMDHIKTIIYDIMEVE